MSYRLVVEPDELTAASQVVTTVWGDPGLAPVSLLRAYTHFGNPTIGAFAAGEMCGVSIGFLAPSGGVHLHSHITGVLPSYQHRGVGFGLKLAQRAWCLGQSITEVTWTFDPMIDRNAYFNMRKLGAVAAGLLPSFYGEMPDVVNRGDDTDRLEVHWHLTSERVERALVGKEVAVSSDIVRTVAVPRDYLALRAGDAEEARRSRARVREELAEAFADGLSIVDFNERHEYCFADT